MYFNTVAPLLREILEASMNDAIFNPFRLVGGTALSLHLGHRESVDIDLFTDAEYDTIKLPPIDHFFKSHYSYVDTNAGLHIESGVSYYVGNSDTDAIKIDIYHTEPFIRPVVEKEHIRMASLEDIVGMKLEVIGHSGRKKDFWDIHELHDHFSIPIMTALYLEKYPYGHSAAEIRNKLTDFSYADDDFEPICLKGKHWELIKLDLIEWENSEK